VATEQSKKPDTLFRIVRVGTGLAFGAMVGSLFAVQPIPNGLTFRITTGAVVAFILSAAIAWSYWRMVERMAIGAAPAQKRRRFILFSVGLAIVGIVSFLYPLKFVPEAKRKDVAVGLSLAIGCITGVAFVMMKVKRFLDADEQQTERDEQDRG
jgi:hypothetical protein